MRRLRRIFSFCLILGFAGFLAFTFLPWKTWVADMIVAKLRAQGLEEASLKIESITLDTVTLSDIRLKDGRGLSLKNLSLGYSPADLLGGKINDLAVKDLNVEIVRQDEVWAVNGIVQAQEGGVFVFPKPDEIPIRNLHVESSSLNFVSPIWSLLIPLKLNWDRQTSILSALSEHISFHQDGIKAGAQSLQVNLRFEDERWRGEWQAENIVAPGYTGLTAKGTMEIAQNILSLNGSLEDAASAGSASFAVSVPFGNPENMKVTITKGNMPWAGGQIAIGNTDISVSGKKGIRLLLDIRKVSVDTLIELVTGQNVEATGTISGKIPVIVKSDGTITLAKGAMIADESGVISLPPGVIPGSGEQIELTRQILENFQYDGLSVDVQEQEKGGVAVLLALSGNNPKVYDGRAVKLNVRLGGGVLEFLQSSLKMLGNPESLLTQEKQ